MHFVVDTGRSDVLIHGPGCLGCPGKPFMWGRSHSFRNNGRKIGTGYAVTDEISINPEGKQIQAIEMVMMSKGGKLSDF